MPSTNQTQHTPGPWRLERRLDDWSIAYGSADRLHGPKLIAQDVRVEANARLIAAAPALLEALEWAARNLEEVAIPRFEEEGRVSSLPNALEQARHAIRVARGEGSSTLDSGGVPGGLKS